jgi:hypothetical protein
VAAVQAKLNTNLTLIQNSTPMFLKIDSKKWQERWQRFIQPAATVQDEAQRQQARLLAALSSSLLAVGIVVAVFWVWTNPNYPEAPVISIGIITAIFVVNILSRTRYHQVGAYLFIVSLLITVGVIYLTGPGHITERMLAMYFLSVAILLASILLSVQAMIAVVGISLIVASLFFFVEDIPFPVAYAFLVFTVVMSSLLVLTTIMRNNNLWRLQESEKRFRLLTLSSPDTICIFNIYG